jgi:hypothetical protein
VDEVLLDVTAVDADDAAVGDALRLVDVGVLDERRGCWR